jgi:hypothetical protein
VSLPPASVRSCPSETSREPAPSPVRTLANGRRLAGRLVRLMAGFLELLALYVVYAVLSLLATVRVLLDPRFRAR